MLPVFADFDQSVEYRHTVQHVFERHRIEFAAANCPGKRCQLGTQRVETGMLEHLVERRRHPAGRRVVAMGAKRSRDMSGREISARPLLPYKVNSKFVAVATEQKMQAGGPACKPQHDRRGVVGAAWIIARVTQRTSRTLPANSIMWSSACTPTAVSAPPGASSGAARQLSSATNCASKWCAGRPWRRLFRAARPALWRATRRRSDESAGPARRRARRRLRAQRQRRRRRWRGPSVIGFSTKMCLRATAAASACAWCWLCGVASTTASIVRIAQNLLVTVGERDAACRGRNLPRLPACGYRRVRT